MINSEEEIWRAYPDIDKIEVSTFGRIRSVKGHYYKSHLGNSGYLQVCFHINDKYINKLVHRLVAETFILNPDNLPQVNHKDNDRTNNNVDNLEFCTASYNAKYRNKFGVSNTETQGHPLFAINLATIEVLRFRSQAEAGRELGVLRKNINKVIKGSRNQAGGFWFTNDDDNAADTIKQKLHDIGGTGLKIYN